MIAALRQRDAWRHAGCGGAAPSTVESVRLDPELKELLAHREEEEGVPVSEVIREALRHHLEAS